MEPPSEVDADKAGNKNEQSKMLHSESAVKHFFTKSYASAYGPEVFALPCGMGGLL